VGGWAAGCSRGGSKIKTLAVTLADLNIEQRGNARRRSRVSGQRKSQGKRLFGGGGQEKSCEIGYRKLSSEACLGGPMS